MPSFPCSGAGETGKFCCYRFSVICKNFPRFWQKERASRVERCLHAKFMSTFAVNQKVSSDTFIGFHLLYYHVPRKGVSISFSQFIHSYFNNGLTFRDRLRIMWFNKRCVTISMGARRTDLCSPAASCEKFYEFCKKETIQ